MNCSGTSRALSVAGRPATHATLAVWELWHTPSAECSTMATQTQRLPTFEIDAILRRIAWRQLGLVTVAQAASEGVDGRALARRRESGALVSVFAQVMRLGAVAPTPVQRILAASLAVPGSMVGATSAAVIHRMPVLAASRNDQPTVLVNAHRSARTAGISVLRSSYALPTQPWCTTRLATPAATLVLLPRFVDRRTLERCLDHSLVHRLVSVRAASDLVDRIPARALPGRRILLELLAQRSSGIGHRSQLEQTVAGWLDDAGLRGWRRNLQVPTGRGGSVEVDFAWQPDNVALEVSPFFTHGSRADQERDAERRELLVVAGWRVVEATDPDLEHRRAFARIAATLATLLGTPAQTSRALSVVGRHRTHAT